jgi:exopolysaccharide production protein ExoQ
VEVTVGTRDGGGRAGRPEVRGPRRGDAIGTWYTASAAVLLSGPVGVPVGTSGAVFCVIALVALRLRRIPARDVYIPVWASLFVLWCATSALWSDDPERTLVDAIGLVLVTLAAIASANTFSTRSILRGLICGVVAVAVLSVLVAVVAPGQGISQDMALQGMYEHRNILSSTLALGLVAMVSGGWALGPRRALRVMLVALVAACTIAAQSITALASLVAAFAVALALGAVRRLPRNDKTLATVGFGALALLCVFLLSHNLTRLVESVGRDPTLTGRTDIWTAVWTQVAERPWLGHGWGAVWVVGDEAGDYVRGYIGYSIDHSHNGALDILVQVGAVGLALAVVALVAFGVTAARVYFRGSTQLGSWPLALLALVLFYNISEAQLVRPLNWWFVFVTAVVLVLREAAGASSSAPAAREP